MSSIVVVGCCAAGDAASVTAPLLMSLLVLPLLHCV
jgi:hypothetical protein